MTDMTQLGKKIVEEIHSTEEYKTYINLRREVEKDPALLLRVTELMEKNSRLHQTDSEELFALCDALTNEYEDVINNELACDFMEAEVVLCRLVQELSYIVLEGLELV